MGINVANMAGWGSTEANMDDRGLLGIKVVNMAGRGFT